MRYLTNNALKRNKRTTVIVLEIEEEYSTCSVITQRDRSDNYVYRFIILFSLILFQTNDCQLPQVLDQVNKGAFRFSTLYIIYNLTILQIQIFICIFPILKHVLFINILSFGW